MRFTGPRWVEGWVNGTGEEDRREERKEKHGIPDANSTCQLDFSGGRSSRGHITTALTLKISRTKGLGGKGSCISFHRVSFQLFNHSVR